jgi:hypothetical protein
MPLQEKTDLAAVNRRVDYLRQQEPCELVDTLRGGNYLHC